MSRANEKEKCGVTAKLKETKRKVPVATGDPESVTDKKINKRMPKHGYSTSCFFAKPFLILDCPVVSVASWLPLGVCSLPLEAATVLSLKQ